MKYRVAIEINSRTKIPSLNFLRRAREAGIKLTFGSNAHDENVGKVDYSVRMARALGLTSGDMFMPAPLTGSRLCAEADRHFRRFGNLQGISRPALHCWRA